MYCFFMYLVVAKVTLDVVWDWGETGSAESMLVHARITLLCVTSLWNLRHFLCNRDPPPQNPPLKLFMLWTMFCHLNSQEYFLWDKKSYKTCHEAWACIGHIWLQKYEIIFRLKKRKHFKSIINVMLISLCDFDYMFNV